MTATATRGVVVSRLRDLGAASWHRLANADEALLARMDDAFGVRLKVQLESARRHNRAFTLSRITCPSPLNVACHCAPRVRTLDAVTVYRGEVVVLWAETGAPTARDAVQRLVGEGLVGEGVPVRSVTFPHDGVTITALLEALQATATAEVSGRAPPIAPADLMIAPADDHASHRRQVASR